VKAFGGGMAWRGRMARLSAPGRFDMAGLFQQQCLATSARQGRAQQVDRVAERNELGMWRI